MIRCLLIVIITRKVNKVLIKFLLIATKKQQQRNNIKAYQGVCMHACMLRCAWARRVGDWLVVGSSVCRVRRLRFIGRAPKGAPSKGNSLQRAPLKGLCKDSRGAEVVEVFGFPAETLPALGEEALAVRSEAEAKALCEVFAFCSFSAFKAYYYLISLAK